MYVLKNKVRERDALHQKKVSLSLDSLSPPKKQSQRSEHDEPCLQSSEESLLTEKNFSAFPHEKVQKGPQLSYSLSQKKKKKRDLRIVSFVTHILV